MKIFENQDLSQYNSYKIKAVAKRAFFPETNEDLKTIFQDFSNTEKIIIGSGHNLILSKPYYDEDIVIFSGNFDACKIENTTIFAEAGIDLFRLSKLALAHQLSGLEMFYDIPSSLGGAVVMNAGAGGEDIKSILISTEYFDPKHLTFHSITKEEIGFEYRNSFFQKNPHLIITRAVLELKPGKKEDILSKMESIKLQRWTKQPREFPNAGSVFKRPAGFYVGAIMDELGLKGYSVGGAKISEKHGGFIINFNNATGKDILDIIQYVQAKVKEKYGFVLEVEQRVV